MTNNTMAPTENSISAAIEPRKVPASSGNLLVQSPAPAPAPKFERVWFTYRSRRWRIAKRGESGNWYLHFEHRGRRYHESLHAAAQKPAIASAKLKIDIVLDAHDAETLSLLDRTRRFGHIKTTCSTISQLLAVHERTVFDLEARSSRDYRNSLARFLRAQNLKESENLAALTPELVGRYVTAIIERARTHTDNLKSSRVRRGGARVLHKVRCLFSRNALKSYSAAGLQLPPLDPLLSALSDGMRELFKHARAEEPEPDPTIIQATLDGWVKLPRNEFLAVGLALSCGLRLGEISKATWSWFTTKEGQPWLFARVPVKNRTGEISLRPIDPFWRILNERADREGWRGPGEVFLLEGIATERKERVFRRISAWMHGLGWRTFFSIHALRAYAGGQVWLRWSPAQASSWLRHSSVKITEDHYTYLQRQSERFQLTHSTRIEWAA